MEIVTAMLRHTADFWLQFSTVRGHALARVRTLRAPVSEPTIATARVEADCETLGARLRLRALQVLEQARPHRGHGATAVAALGLDRAVELGEGAAQIGQHEQRIEAEAAAAA